jgi:branched-chain amino acid aminotransferase
VIGGGLVTPHTVACPEGITRETVLALAAGAAIPAVVRDVSLTEMYNADEVFCTGTMGELAGVTAIDGRTIGTGAVGPLTTRLAAIYQNHATTNGVPLELEPTAG